MKHQQEQSSAEESILAETELAKAESAGWDPFQVWRTRVREPHLQGRTARDPQVPEGAPVLKKTA